MGQPSPSTLKIFSALVGLTSLGIFAQAITAGEFVSQRHRGGWIDAHGIISDVVAVLSLALMVFTIVKLRKVSRQLLAGTIALFFLVIVQSTLGHQITDNDQDWLIGVHVPLAFVVFAIAVWLPISARMLRRSSALPG